MIPEPQRDFSFGRACRPLLCVTAWASLHGHPVAGSCWTDDHCWWILPWVLSLAYKLTTSSVGWLQAQLGHLDLLEAWNKSCKSPISFRPHCCMKGISCVAFCLPLQVGSPCHSGCTENVPYPQTFQMSKSWGSVLAGSLSGSYRCKQLQCSRLGLICWVVIGLVKLNFMICPTQAACGWLAH